MSQSTSPGLPARMPMSSTQSLRARLSRPVPFGGKELHALLPVAVRFWAMLLVTGMLSMTMDLEPIWLGVLYITGCITLGATTFGHEFAARTWWLVLSQPLDRARLWVRKMTALGLVLVASVLLYLLTLSCTRGDSHHATGNGLITAGMIIVGAWLGITVAPFAALLIRNTIYAVVLNIGIALSVGAGWALFINDRIMEGRLPQESFEIVFTICAGGVLLLCGCVTLPLGFRTFMGLQLLEDYRPLGGLPLPVGRMITRLATSILPAGAKSARALWAKELHLQLPALAYFGFVALLACYNLIRRWGAADGSEFSLGGVYVLCAIGSVPLAGAFAASEERSLGVWSSQVTLPAARWKQWGCKVGMALAVTLAGSVLLPTLIGMTYHLAGRSDWPFVGLRLSDSCVFAYFVVTGCAICLFTSASSDHAVSAFLLAGVGMALIAFCAGYAFEMNWYYILSPDVVSAEVSIDPEHPPILYALVTGQFVDKVDPAFARLARRVLWFVAGLFGTALTILPVVLGYRQYGRETGRARHTAIGLVVLMTIASILGVSLGLLSHLR